MITDYLQKLRSIWRDARLFLVAWGLQWATIFAVLFVLLSLYVLRLGYGPAFVGTVMAVMPLTVGVLSLVAGAVGRRWGARRALISGQVVSALGYALIPFSEFVPEIWQRKWLMMSVAVTGIGGALVLVNSLPFLMSVTNTEERDHAFAVKSMVHSMGGVLGSLGAGLLPGLFVAAFGLSFQDPAAYGCAIWFCSLLLIPSILAMLATHEVSPRQTQGRHGSSSPAPYALIVLVAVIRLVRVSGLAAPSSFFAVYLDNGLRTPAALIGALKAAGELVAMPAAMVMPLLVARWGHERSIAWGQFGIALSILPLALVRHWSAAGLGLLGLSVLNGITGPVFDRYSQEIVPTDWWALMSGVMAMGQAVGAAAMSYVGGQIIAGWGYSRLFLVAAGLLATGALLFWACFRVPRGELARKAVERGSG